MALHRPAAAALLMFALVSSAWNGLAQAAPPDAGRKNEIRGVITQQLDALAHDDGTAAEALAAPGIREKFPDGARFLDMVRTNYGALIHPRSTQFADIVDTPDATLQKVVVVAADGTVWSAIYSLQQVDGRWLISGCVLTRDETQQAI